MITPPPWIEFTLHTTCVAMSDNPHASFWVNMSYFCCEIIHLSFQMRRFGDPPTGIEHPWTGLREYTTEGIFS